MDILKRLSFIGEAIIIGCLSIILYSIVAYPYWLITGKDGLDFITKEIEKVEKFFNNLRKAKND